MITVTRLTEPVGSYAFAADIERGLKLNQFRGNIPIAVRWLLSNCHHPAIGVWIAIQKHEPCGMIVTALPTTPLVQLPEIFALANWGSTREAGQKLVDAAIAFCRKAGFNRIIGCNCTGFEDKFFIRRYRSSGREIKRVGTLWEFIEEIN